MNVKRGLLATIAALGLLPGCILRAQSYTTVVVFGDSLSDTGNVAHLVNSQFGVRYPSTSFNYADGRFTDDVNTTPAAKAYAGVWVEQLAAQFAARPLVKASLDGGTNYAYGDATTMDGMQMIPVGPGLPSITIPNMGQQIASYLATNPTPSPSTLYVVFGGGNDLYADSSTAGINAAAQREATLVQRLILAGATNFLVPNLPPLGAAPNYSGASNAATLNAAAAQFRAMLAADLQTVQQAAMTTGKTVQIFQPDLYTQFLAAEGSPAGYGFSNVTAMAQGTAGINPDTYVFWDGLHPTTTGHHFIAAIAENLLAPLVTSSTAFTLSSNSFAANQTITLRAAVSGTGPLTKPSGLVTFYSGNALPAIGSAALDATGTATATFSPAASASPYQLTAVYAGDTAYARNTSAAQTLTFMASPIPTATTLTVTPSPANLGAAVTLAATVTSSNGAPAGTVNFLDGTTMLGTGTLSAGVASYTTSALSSGSHTLTAAFVASGTYAGSTSAAVAEVIATPSFQVTFSPSTLTVQHGASGTVNVTLTSAGGANGTISLSCGTLPAHTSCAFSPASVSLTASAPQNATLTVGTTAVSGLAMPARPGRGRNLPFYAVALLPLCGLRVLRRSLRGLGTLALLALIAAGTVGMAGCGGGSSSSTSATTAPGTYSVVVTATLAGGTVISNQAPLTVVVQ